LRRHRALENACVIDLGCGIGRLTSYLLDAGISRYLGTDILPEILAEARNLAAGRPEFRFEIVTDCTIPERDNEADIVCAFSLITHLLDEEAFLYFRETARVLKPGGLAVFSFLDFAHWFHQKRWAEYVEGYTAQRDLLKFFEKDTLRRFGEMVGLKTIEIIEAGEPFPVSGGRSVLADGTPAPQSVTSGQSLLFMTKG
jgi:SAM-dependent methyltransferase